jgi:ADP-ribose pyrophosphatase YjhB (NUDIX family)
MPERFEKLSEYDLSFMYCQVSQAGIWIKDEKVLLVRLSQNGLWDIPGGRIDKDEDPQVAFRREMKEEVGMNAFEVISLVDADVWKTKSGRWVTILAYLIDSQHGDIQLSHEHSEYGFFTLEEALALEFNWTHAHRMIRKAFDAYQA